MFGKGKCDYRAANEHRARSVNLSVKTLSDIFSIT